MEQGVDFLPERDDGEIREIRRLARGLDRRNPVRRLVEALLNGQAVSIAAILPAFQTLTATPGLHWREQELAVWALGRAPLSPPQRRVAAEALIPLLEPSWGLHPRERFAIAFSRLALLSLPVTLWTYNISGGSMRDWYVPLTAIAFSFASGAVMLPFVLPLSSVLEDIRRNRIRAGAIRSLGRLRVPLGLDGVALALQEAFGGLWSQGKKQVRNAAADALPQLLDTLTPDHYGRLAAHTVPCLCLVLNSPDEKLVVSVLRALALVGDGRAVAPVERLVNQGRTASIRATASEILPILQELQQQENAPSTLLRATSAPETPPELLLRPAQHLSEPDPATLLRSSAKKNGV